MPRMPTITRDAPWHCIACGYLMTASAPDHGTADDAVPTEDDVSVCLNCGAPYVRHGTAWLPPTEAETASFEPDLVDKLAEMGARARRHGPNRPPKGGRA